MNSTQLEVLQSTLGRGDFYVENDCCVSCGVPQAVAPDLVGWADESHYQCYWKKQPETPEELEQAFAIFSGQEVACHRYAGRDPKIRAKIGRENCDYPEERTATEQGDYALKFWMEPGFFERIWTRIFRAR